jgi:hypothetical protein
MVVTDDVLFSAKMILAVLPAPLDVIAGASFTSVTVTVMV